MNTNASNGRDGIDPYGEYVHQLLAILRGGRQLPTGPLAPVPAVGDKPYPGRRAAPEQRGFGATPHAVLLAPHPDDECVTGGLALRLVREAGWRVTVVPVTLGSRRERRAARLAELRAACGVLGFECVPVAEEGLESAAWPPGSGDESRRAADARALAEALARLSASVLFFPHAGDAHRTHVGTHRLALAALAALSDWRGWIVETEFWGTMADPNLMVQIEPQDVALLMCALARHTGEVARNPYHLFLPAWMQDSVRRGAELVGGLGEKVPAIDFALLYRVRRWADGGPATAFEGGRLVTAADDPSALFQK